MNGYVLLYDGTTVQLVRVTSVATIGFAVSSNGEACEVMTMQVVVHHTQTVAIPQEASVPAIAAPRRLLELCAS